MTKVMAEVRSVHMKECEEDTEQSKKKSIHIVICSAPGTSLPEGALPKYNGLTLCRLTMPYLLGEYIVFVCNQVTHFNKVL